jgi:gamma-glutamyltranspeptidase/glutathione hydrolase
LSSHYLKKRSQLVTNQALITPVAAGVPDGADLNNAPDTAPKPHGTTSLAIVDQEGNAVSMTLTIEHQFGSHLFVDGFFLNNELTDFSFIPRNQQGQWVANRVAAFKRPRSAIASSMVFGHGGKLVAISGSPGGSQIICYVAKNLIQMLDFNMNPRDSAASGNLCSVNDIPNLEADSDVSDFKARLNAMGEAIMPRALLSGAVNIKRALSGGWYGAADPRREGMAVGD